MADLNGHTTGRAAGAYHVSATTLSDTRKRVLLVDPHAVMREGLKLILRELGGTIVVGEASDGIEAVSLCQSLRPDLVIMDLQLSSLDGVDAIAKMRRSREALSIVVLSGVVSEIRATQAFKAGAHAFVLKRSGSRELSSALAAVSRGCRHVDPAMKAEQIQVDGECLSPAGTDSATKITVRERQVLKMIAEGKRTRRIAEELFVSLKTVETHRMNVMRKLDAHNAAEVSYWARRFGLIEV
ncbi:response regulator [Cupriavidus pampae]|uniref:Transcriptional regulatory protein LiaR n=1 Tax=Cupriavidus pampae TaxID=659251 RepID=A0ABN7ZIU6_9BURK|nr:response regulator [Cupriavidus pampae]CAG9185900.1 Transcriptional regulatory protein LiaR [Cupriavidus pampae]